VRSVALVHPGDLATRTGGYAYDRRAFAALGERGWRVRYVALPDRFPLPDAETLATADAALAGLPDRTVTVVDGLALGAMPAVAGRNGRRLALVALVHHPLCLETGLDPVTAARLRASERRALAACRRVIATSPSTAATLAADFAVPGERLTVAVPGTDPAPVAAGTGDPPQLLCVGTLTPRKGQRLLLGALAPLRDLRWRLLLAGSADRDPATAAAIRAAVADLGLGERVTVAGELDGAALDAAYAAADLLVSASFHEGYGMALAEALARGLPIVAASGGAVADTVPPDAGLLVPPGDAAALGEALRRVLTDPGLRARLRAGALAARERLPRWEDTAAAIEGVLSTLGGDTVR
jgi:glycosyltransferase involved in cell wall biosynthesis